MKTYDEEINGFLSKKKVPLYGFADLTLLPKEDRYGLPRSISIAFPARKRIIRQITKGPTVEYDHEYVRLNKLLLKTGKEIAEFIGSLGFYALTLEATVRKLNMETLTVTLPHKTSATLAGLGWIGKSALLVTKKFGSAIRFTTILTDLPLETGDPVTESECGECDICYVKCPAKAISGKKWTRGLKREEFYDAFACREKAKEQSDAIHINNTICGICIANCPYTKKYLRSYR